MLAHRIATVALLLTAATAQAASSRLYTKPDPSAKGGIKGRMASPATPIAQILAIPPDEPRLVYEGAVSGTDRREFLFSGLPMRKYDLVVIYEGSFYEGLNLHRDENTLTRDDKRKIEEIVQASEPFFTKKVIHRVEGTTGRGNFARCICTFLRDRMDDTGKGQRRTFKLMMLKDVGPGWQVVRARDLYPLYVDAAHALPGHRYSKALGGIRVADYIKDLGDVRATE